MRTMTFETITGQGVTQIEKQASQIESSLKSLPGLEVKRMPYIVYHFTEPSVGKVTQWRIRFYVSKPRGRTRTTWNQVYEAVNSVKAAVYKFL